MKNNYCFFTKKRYNKTMEALKMDREFALDLLVLLSELDTAYAYSAKSGDFRDLPSGVKDRITSNCAKLRQIVIDGDEHVSQ
jgi:hypothetical protein